MEQEAIYNFFNNQLSDWPLAKDNYNSLSLVKTKEFKIDGYTYKVQFNPSRIISSTAKVDEKSVRERNCFLCSSNLPIEQKSLSFNEHYSILVNPFPIFPVHFTIPEINHIPQLIKNHFADMLDIAKTLSNYVIFYNGPKCGASAPDHAHFQAGNKDFLPLQKEWIQKEVEKIAMYNKSYVGYIKGLHYITLVIESQNKSDATTLFEKVYNSIETKPDQQEPMMNILVWYEKDKWITTIFPREKHRPDCFYNKGEENLLISPGSVDIAGVFIVPYEKDFNKITAVHINSILKEVGMSLSKLHELTKRIKEKP